MTATQEAPSVNHETFEFQAETKELLSLMIHSIYSNKEIFLRELISNASDAMDKLKFEALTNPDLAVPSQEDLVIFLEPNLTERTLTLHDKGIGMNREELVKLIGTIAKSGTREFIENLKEQKDQNKLVSPELIGQFGVGFYSSFIVSDKVRVVSRKAGETTATQWESTGDGKFTISEAERAEAGTSITLFLKPIDEEDGMQDYTQEWTLKTIVKKYSDFVSYPIQMDVERTEVERDAEGKPVENGQSTTTIERITLNSMKAIWTRPQAEVTDEEYNEFYKHISHDWHPPLKTIRFKFEGNFEAQALLFLPSKAPFDLFYQNTQRGIQLYVKRVFIMDDCKELMPNYLRFVKGVVDSEDLSLNISREILQQNRQIQAIRSRLIKKVLSALDDLKANDVKTYEQFWGEFGKALKEGLFEDHANQQALLDLCLFQSTNHDGEMTSLKGYLSRMKADQDTIYYMTGEKRSVMEQSPHLEAFRAKGIEVLFLTDPVDEIWVQQVFEFEGHALQSVGKGMVELGSEDEKKQAAEAREEKQKNYASLLETIQKNLNEDVKEVRISTRLTSSAACLVGNENDMTPQMEQLLKSMNQEVPKTKRILELNPEHPVLQQLQKRFEQNKEDALIGEFSQLLLGQALLAEGSALPNPGAFSQLVAKLMVNQLR